MLQKVNGAILAFMNHLFLSCDKIYPCFIINSFCAACRYRDENKNQKKSYDFMPLFIRRRKTSVLLMK